MTYVDSSIEDKTLFLVLNNFLSNSVFDVRKFSLPEDKKADYSRERSRNYELQNQTIIFRKILEVILNNPGKYDKQLKSLGINKGYLRLLYNMDKSKLEYSVSMMPSKNGVIPLSFFPIFYMPMITDDSGSKRIDLFDDHQQRTIHEYDPTNKKLTYHSYNKRIYLDIPLTNDGIDFLTAYKLKCIERGFPSKMKGFGSSGYDGDGEIDTTILYSNDFYLDKHIAIL